MKIGHLTEGVSHITEDRLYELLRTDFSEAHQAAMNGKFIFKGMYLVDSDGIFYMSKIENRPSRNTHNFYTMWLNNHPDWSRFPKRNVVGTNSADVAGSYGFDTYVILPKNGSKIGMCPTEDLWVSFKALQELNTSADIIMDMFKHVFGDNVPTTFEELETRLKKLQADEDYLPTPEYLDHHDLDHKVLDIIKEKGLYNTFRYFFSPTNFKVTSVEQMSNTSGRDGNEVWFDSDFIAIPYHERKKYLYNSLEESTDDTSGKWIMPSEKTMKSDFEEYKFKEDKKWKDRAERMGFRFPLFKDFNSYKRSIQMGTIIDVNEDRWDDVENLSKNYDIADIEDMVSGYTMPRDVQRIQKGFENNDPIPYPVILKGEKGMFIMSGNTRLNVARVMGITPKALVVDVSQMTQ